MKKTINLLVLMVANTIYGQWTESTSLISTNTNKIVIGADAVQGAFGVNEGVLQIISPTNQTSFLTFQSGTKAMNIGVGPYGNALYIPNNESFKFSYGGTQVMVINPNATVSIGTTASPLTVGGVDLNDYKLFVGGGILANEVRVSIGWADYVFDKDYTLPTLQEVEKFIKENGHLENVPSAEEIEKNGLELGEMSKIQQEKIEELTLYTIDQQRQLDHQTKEIEELKALVNILIQKNK